MSRLADVMETYLGSDGARTKALYDELEAVGPIGVIAMNLIRAQKTSERAKDYRGGRYRRASYGTKQWSMDNACAALLEHGGDIVWGWGVDELQPVHRHVLYVDTPCGQVSFHTEVRGQGPDYPGPWDGKKGTGPDRLTRWCARLLDGVPA